MNFRAYFAELIGTFLLSLAVSISIAANLPVPTPIIAGVTLGLCVYTLGKISGTHVNPAVTVALLSVKKIGFRDAAMYVVSQLLGAILAILLVPLLLGNGPAVYAGNELQLGVTELLGAFILVFGVSSVVFGKVKEEASGLVIGGSLALGAMLASSVSNGVLNPAVAIAIGSISWMYILGPIVGGLLAVWAYKLVSNNGRS